MQDRLQVNGKGGEEEWAGRVECSQPKGWCIFLVHSDNHDLQKHDYWMQLMWMWLWIHTTIQ